MSQILENSIVVPDSNGELARHSFLRKENQMAFQPGDYVMYRNHAATVIHAFEKSANIKFLSPFVPFSQQMDMWNDEIVPVKPEHKLLIDEWINKHVSFSLSSNGAILTGVIVRVWTNCKYVTIKEDVTGNTYVRDILSTYAL